MNKNTNLFFFSLSIPRPESNIYSNIFKVPTPVPTLPSSSLECKTVSQKVYDTQHSITDAFHSTANNPKKKLTYRHILKLNVQCATV